VNREAFTSVRPAGRRRGSGETRATVARRAGGSRATGPLAASRAQALPAGRLKATCNALASPLKSPQNAAQAAGFGRTPHKNETSPPSQMLGEKPTDDTTVSRAKARRPGFGRVGPCTGAVAPYHI